MRALECAILHLMAGEQMLSMHKGIVFTQCNLLIILKSVVHVFCMYIFHESHVQEFEQSPCIQFWMLSMQHFLLMRLQDCMWYDVVTHNSVPLFQRIKEKPFIFGVCIGPLT